MGTNFFILPFLRFQMMCTPELVLSGPTTPRDASQTSPVPDGPKGTEKGLPFMNVLIHCTQSETEMLILQHNCSWHGQRLLNYLNRGGTYMARASGMCLQLLQTTLVAVWSSIFSWCSCQHIFNRTCDFSNKCNRLGTTLGQIILLFPGDLTPVWIGVGVTVPVLLIIGAVVGAVTLFLCMKRFVLVSS